ncbi:MAG: sucrose-phosphate phosphatase [Cyanobacteria bacterium MAG IRC3_bin_20]|nr:sucrose-phosphate phosphatase [Cyanobacteria bacterium MAG IRC3_bin_20]
MATAPSRQRRVWAMKDLLLVTDLEHTLVGDGQALARLNQTLRTLRSRINLVYATGRSLAGARQLQREEDLLEPEGWATGVGSALLWRGEPDLAWDRRLQRHWDRPALSRLLANWSDLILQPASEQTPYKLSYELAKPRLGTAAHQFEQRLRATLRQAGLQAQVVFSSGCQLDLLPPAAGKGAVSGYLQQKLGLQPGQVLCCGDSGNDRSMLGGPWWGVMVRNARPELLAWWRQVRPDTLLRSHHHHAGAILHALHTLPLL